MGRYRDDGEVQIDNSTNGRFRNVFQRLSVIAALNVGTLLSRFINYLAVLHRNVAQARFQAEWTPVSRPESALTLRSRARTADKFTQSAQA